MQVENSDFARDFGSRLKWLRENRSLTQPALAALIGKKGATVSDWERGKHEPSLSDIHALAGALGVTLSKLVVGESSERSLIVTRAATGKDAAGGAFAQAVHEEPATSAEVVATRRHCEVLLDLSLDQADKVRGGLEIVYGDLVDLVAKMKRIRETSRDTTAELMARVHEIERGAAPEAKPRAASS